MQVAQSSTTTGVEDWEAAPTSTSVLLRLNRVFVLGSDHAAGLYDIGPKDDFEEISRILDDDDWKWTNAQRIFKEVGRRMVSIRRLTCT